MSNPEGLAEEICGKCSHKYRCPECFPNTDQGHCDFEPKFEPGDENSLVPIVVNDDTPCIWLTRKDFMRSRFEPYPTPSREEKK